jgi:hypothetical protein
MQLAVNGHLHSICQLAPDFAILESPSDHPPSEAEIVISIDGSETRWRVCLPCGISASAARTALALPLS